MKKIALAALLGIVIGSVVLYFQYNSSQKRAATSANTSGEAILNNGTTIKLSESMTAPHSRVTSDRTALWLAIKTAPSLEKVFFDLLKLPNAAYPAHSLRSACLSAGVNESAPGGITFEQRMTSETRNLDIVSQKKAVALLADFSRRCERLKDINFAVKELRAAVVNDSTVDMRMLPSETRGPLHEQLNIDSLPVLQKVLEDPVTAAAWLTYNAHGFRTEADRLGYFSGLNFDDTLAVTWLAICNIGGSCSDGDIARLYACPNSNFCGGVSVQDAIRSSYQDSHRLAMVISRADRLAGDLVAQGATLFRQQPRR
jgi:hypothetical protein